MFMLIVLVIALWSFDLMVLLQPLLAWGCLVLALLVYEPPGADGAPVRTRDCQSTGDCVQSPATTIIEQTGTLAC